MFKYTFFLITFLVTGVLFANSHVSYSDIKSKSFDSPSKEFRIYFEENFDKVKNNKNLRTKFFKNLPNNYKNQTIQDKKYVMKSCLVNGYLDELEEFNKNHNLEDTIEYAQAQIITDCDNYIREISPKLKAEEKKELILLIRDVTTWAKYKKLIK